MQTRILAAILLIIPLSCRESPPEPPLSPGPTPRIELTVSDVGVTEMWLRIRILDSAGQRGFSLTRDAQLLLFYPFGAPLDTVILDGGLVPGHVYTYRAYRFSHGNLTDSSVVQPRTLDTTSHNFTWEIDTLGAGSSSVLYDVAIINDTLAYAVGEIYLRDSTGQLDPIVYNLAIWNGRTWKIQRVPYDDQGSHFYSLIRWLFAFDGSNIWFGNSVHWNGQSFHNVDIGTSVFYGIGANRMWGNLSGELYVVGNNGTVARSQDNGAKWQQLSSGTTLNFYDVYGNLAAGGGVAEVVAVAADLFVSSDRKIINISGSTVTSLPDSGLCCSLQAVWFKPQRRYYIGGGGGLSSKRLIAQSGAWTQEASSLISARVYGIRGTDLNDVFTCGAFGEVLHFNGWSWHKYPEAAMSGIYQSIAVSKHLVIAVGEIARGAIVLRGYR